MGHCPPVKTRGMIIRDDLFIEKEISMDTSIFI
jgi:hypothetical protein